MKEEWKSPSKNFEPQKKLVEISKDSSVPHWIKLDNTHLLLQDDLHLEGPALLAGRHQVGLARGARAAVFGARHEGRQAENCAPALSPIQRGGWLFRPRPFTCYWSESAARESEAWLVAENENGIH
ncbi:hypothetical protein CEXT_196381 [Caerostris extrusa]|uniref:Uncharacterized protein n=1 Tax=Caerostris extrusa TaxID=172846 RepID=A0AAV4M9S6_CAEEX|nr:hypothetical protein CEXT_196381 [Caerostris extrusa]